MEYGANTADAIVTDCINMGEIIAECNNVGGIAGGGGSSNAGEIRNCCNLAKVTGNSKVGGIIGNTSTNFTITINLNNNYNKGEINGTDQVGGIIGFWGHGTMKNSYNIGTVNGSSYVGSLIGNRYRDYTRFDENNYYLTSELGTFLGTQNNETTVADESEQHEVRTATEMKSAEFLELLKGANEENPFVADTQNINNGYPILKDAIY